MNRFIAVLFLALASFGSLAHAASAWPLKIFDAKTGVEIAETEWVQQIAAYDEIVIGEKHDTSPVQATQAWVIDEVMNVRKSEPFTVAWEFLNWSDKARIDGLFADYAAKKLSVSQFMVQVFGAAGATTYEPIVESIRRHGGILMPTNLSRTEKSPVVRGGLGALDPALLPPDFQLGGQDYFDRFFQAMGGHGDPATYANYFAAQCLVDEVVAHHLTHDVTTKLRFLVIGNFHTAYFDGVYASLVRRAPGVSRALVHIENAAEYTEADMQASLRDAKYGPIADYMIFAGTPAVPGP